MDEYIGNDVAAVCRKQIAKQKLFKCPRKNERYMKVKASCFDIAVLIRDENGNMVGQEKAFDMLFPMNAGVAGTGESKEPAIAIQGVPL
jgi:hypothetical protein